MKLNAEIACSGDEYATANVKTERKEPKRCVLMSNELE